MESSRVTFRLRQYTKKYQAELQLFMAVPWLPKEAVGVGAKWRIHTPDTIPQLFRSEKVVVTELVAMEDSVVTLRATTTSDGPKQRSNDREYESLTSRGTKTVVVDLADPVSLLPSKLDSSQSMTMTRKHFGLRVTHRVQAKMSIERIGEAVLSEE